MKTPMTKLILAAVAALSICLGARAVPSSEGLVAYYPFNGDILDASGNDYHWTGTVSTWTTNRAGEENSAALFSGSGALGLNEKFLETRIETNLTVAVWVKPSAMLPTNLGQSTNGTGGKNLPTSNTQVLYPSHGGYSNYAGLGLFVAKNGIAVVRHRNDYIPVTLIWYNDIGEDWIHVAITVSDDGKPLLYVNGQYVAEGCQILSGSPCFIGGSLYDSSYSTKVGPFLGVIDDMRFYNRALDAEEIARFIGTETITWLNEDGSEIDTTEVGDGFTPSHAEPSKSATAPYRWVFTGWTPELEAAVSNTTYTATFKKIADLSLVESDWTAADGDEIVGEATHEVTIPGGAHVTINGVAVAGAGGGAAVDAPEFADDGESVTTKFEKGEGDTWKITAFAEMSNESRGTDVTDSQIKVYSADTLEELKNATIPVAGATVKETKSAVKTIVEVPAPSGKDSQFFRVDFGE